MLKIPESLLTGGFKGKKSSKILQENEGAFFKILQKENVSIGY
jgi:hypothetical protein